MSNTSKVVKAKLEGGRLLRMEVSSVDEARFIADKLVWQRFYVNEVISGPAPSASTCYTHDRQPFRVCPHGHHHPVACPNQPVDNHTWETVLEAGVAEGRRSSCNRTPWGYMFSLS